MILTRMSLSLTFVAAATGSLCYDAGSAEYVVQPQTSCGSGRDHRLPESSSTRYARQSVVETSSASECQHLCHVSENCRGFEWVTSDGDMPLPTPKCLFRTRTDNTKSAPHSTCYTKSKGGAYAFCAKEGDTCWCNTEARFGHEGAWVHKPQGGSDYISCTREAFGATNVDDAPKECQCATHDGMILLLDASTYVDTNNSLWLDESGSGHHAILAYPGEKKESSAPSHVSTEPVQHFHFDGKDDYLSVKDLNFNGEHRLTAVTVSIKFRTDYKTSGWSKNWALIDFDRSEYFNLYVRPDSGKIGFSSHGSDKIDDMVGATVVNDGEWHTVTVTYTMATKLKTLYVDGVEDGRQENVHPEGIGSSATRYGMVGEGSEASKQFGGSNGIYFHGDIARIEIYTTALSSQDLKGSGTPSREAISSESRCTSVPGGSCTWLTSHVGDSYYLEHNDVHDTATLTYTSGSAPAVLFRGDISFSVIPSQVQVSLQQGCHKGDKLEAAYLYGGEVESTYNPSTCVLTLEAHPMRVNGVAWQTVLQSVTFSTTSEDYHNRRIFWSVGLEFYSLHTGHFYQVFREKVTWAVAKTRCEALYRDGMAGYLATITSATENDVIRSNLKGEGWVGLSQDEEGVWRWVSGPEAGEDINRGRIVGRKVGRDFVPEGEAYNVWHGREPNNYEREDSGYYHSSGKWRSDPHSKKNAAYICEWGGSSPLVPPAHGEVTVKMQGCVRTPCNYITSASCAREKGCRWSDTGATCYAECKENYFSPLCNVYCHPDETCSGNGKCNGDGKCVCSKRWGGPTCSWQRHICRTWGDPHYTAFGGKRFNFHGVPTASNQLSGTYALYERPQSAYKLLAKHYRCGGSENKPVGCIKQALIASNVSRIEINIDPDAGSASSGERGIIHVHNTSGSYSINTLTDKPTLPLPLPLGDIALVKVKHERSKITRFYFEFPNEGDIHTRVIVIQSVAGKRPLLHAAVEHYGSTAGVRGLCVGRPCERGEDTLWGRDCTKDTSFAAEVASAEPFQSEVAAVSVGTSGCEGNEMASQWAAGCCQHIRQCGGSTVYNQCVFDNCHMGWDGSVDTSQCTTEGVADSLLLDRECEASLCTKNQGGVGCDECRVNYYGSDCMIYCDRDYTCNGHGTCNMQGECWCEAGFKYNNVAEGRFCLSMCQAQRTERTCRSKGKRCRWSREEGACDDACPKSYYGASCSKFCDAKKTCSGKGNCDANGDCVCKTGYEGEDCGTGKYTCSAWGDPHYTTFAGKRYDFFGPATMQQPNTTDDIDIQYELFSSGTLHMTARHWKCNSRATCMKEFAIWDERGGSVEVRLDGSLRVNCSVYTKVQVAKKVLEGEWKVMPRSCKPGNVTCQPGTPVLLTAAQKANRGHGNAFTYFFELSDTVMVGGNMTKKQRLTVQVAARSKAIDVYIKYLGPNPYDHSKSGVAGLCLDKPGSGKPGTGVQGCFTDKTGPPSCAVVPLPTCWSGVDASDCGFCEKDKVVPTGTKQWRCDDPNGSGQRAAEACCKKQERCNTDDNADDSSAYKQCIWDECALGNDGECLDNHGAALTFDDQSMDLSCVCDNPHQAFDQETGECGPCKSNYYNTKAGPCTRYCTPEETCSGHGTCDGAGLCWCDDGFEGDHCGSTPPPPSTACNDQYTHEACNNAKGCFWAFEESTCFRDMSNTPPACWELLTAAKCALAGCHWEGSNNDGACRDSRPLPPVTCTAQAGSFTAQTSTVEQPACVECAPPAAGQQVIVSVAGCGAAHPDTCKAAAQSMLKGGPESGLCQDGWVLVTRV